MVMVDLSVVILFNYLHYELSYSMTKKNRSLTHAVPLLMHYPKFTSEDENVDHSNCHEYSVCWCRLVKKWKDPKEETSEDDANGLTRKILDGPAESSIIKEGDSRVFGALRKIQLGALAYQDAGTCPVKEIINAATLLCQIGIFCRMPG